MDISPYRRTYFALCKELGITDDMRHEFNAAIVRKGSTKDFTLADWRAVVAELQRRAGLGSIHGRPHIGTNPGEPGNEITAGQYELIATIAARISWHTPDGLERLARKLLNQDFRARAWSGKLEDLTRAEAGTLIAVLRRMAGSGRRE